MITGDHKLTAVAIAKELDIKEASVRMALSRARKKAYELIKREVGIDTY